MSAGCAFLSDHPRQHCKYARATEDNIQQNISHHRLNNRPIQNTNSDKRDLTGREVVQKQIN